MLNDNSYFTINLFSHLIKYLAIHLIFIIVLIVLNYKDIVKQFKSIKIKTWALLFLVLLLAFHLRINSGIAFQPSSETEWEYSSLAKHLTTNSELPYITHLYGYPFILSIFFKLFGANMFTVFYLNVIIGSLSVLMMFLFSYLIFRKKNIALLSALVLSILPRHIYFSRVGASENISIFFMLITFIVLVISVKVNTKKMYLLAFSLLAYTGEIKAESLVLIGVFFVYFWINKKSINKRHIAIGLVSFIILSIPVSYWYIKHDDLKFIINKSAGLDVFELNENSQYPELGKISSRIYNIEKFISTLFDLSYHNIVILISLIFSFIAFIRKRYAKELIFLFSIVAINLTIYIIAILPSSERYIVMTYPGLIPIIGLGLYCMNAKISNLFSKEYYRKAVFLIIILGIIFSTFSLTELIVPRAKFYWIEYSDINDIIKSERLIEKNVTIICCGYMKHCDFLMPNRKVITIDEGKVNIQSSIKNYYIRSGIEEASGCDEDMLRWFIYKYNLTRVLLSKKLPHIQVFEVN